MWVERPENKRGGRSVTQLWPGPAWPLRAGGRCGEGEEAGLRARSASVSHAARPRGLGTGDPPGALPRCGCSCRVLPVPLTPPALGCPAWPPG